jgi:hypothetical protein
MFWCAKHTVFSVQCSPEYGAFSTLKHVGTREVFCTVYFNFVYELVKIRVAACFSLTGSDKTVVRIRVINIRIIFS